MGTIQEHKAGNMNVVKTIYTRLTTVIDIRDILLLSGLVMLFYGLYLLRPWAAFTVCGILLMLISYLIMPKKAER